jgi:hypothetical protein
MKKKQDFDPFAPANRVNRVEVSPFVFSRVVSKIESKREEKSYREELGWKGAMLGSGAKSVGLSLNVTWIFAALVVVFLEVMVIRGALQGPNTGDIASAELMGDFLNQTEQLYDHEN